MDLEIALQRRAALGKENKRLRRQGVVPGVVFGKDTPSLPVQVESKAFETLYRAAGRTSIVKARVDGSRSSQSVMIKGLQRHPISGQALHVDFFVVNLTEEMQADIPLSFVGEAPAIEQFNATLMTPIDHIKVRALPADLPHEIEVDLSALVDMDAAIHVRDLPLSDKVTLLNDPDELLAKVLPPRVEEEVEAPAEGVEEAEGAEGAGGGEPGTEAGEQSEDQPSEG